MELLLGSDNAEQDRRNFFKTQLIFWVLAATDGHGKNFSIIQRALTLLAQKLEPEVQSVSMPHRIVRSEADLDAWLTEVKKNVLDKLHKWPVQT